MGKTGVSAFAIYRQQQKRSKPSILKKPLKRRNKSSIPKPSTKHIQSNLNSKAPTKSNALKRNHKNKIKKKVQMVIANKLEDSNIALKSSNLPSQNETEINRKLLKPIPKHKKVSFNVQSDDKVTDKINSIKKVSKKTPIKTVNTKQKTISKKGDIEFFNVPQKMLHWIIGPVSPEDFFQTYWEKKPVCIKRTNRSYYNNILSTNKLDTIFRKNSLFFTRNVDVVSYVNGKRETHNPEGRAVPAMLWSYYEDGCSIRILNPQTYCSKLHTILAALQEYFGCMVGVNAYLTPSNSQGFAPHFDDIEAFVLQLEGRKHWKLYAPLTPEEVLPRFSSSNLKRNEIGTPIKEITLEAGDMLYFPRGIIHEAHTDGDAHSLHITISVYQKTAYVDLLEHIFRPALLQAAKEDPEFREGLPMQHLQHIGFANEGNSSQMQSEITNKVKTLFSKLTNYISVHSAADELGKQFMWDAMPPVASKSEKSCMIHNDGEKMNNGKVDNKVQIDLNVKIRLFRYHCLRMTPDEGDQNSIRIYYCTDNAKYYHGEEQQYLVMDKQFVPAIKYLVKNYPCYVEVDSLPLENETDRMQIIADLWERGLLVTELPLQFYNGNN